MLADKYHIEKLLAFGGMGRVYKGTQKPIGRTVAIKVMSPLQSDPENSDVYAKRFFREASLLGQLSHPNMVVLHDYGVLNGANDEQSFFLVMEFLDGRTLREAMKAAGRLGIERAVHIGKQVCSALFHAHEKGVIHRDLKPPNIILVERGGDPDFVKLVDFGLVKQLDQEPDEEVTRDDTFVGSPLYMAPEQFTKRQTDIRSEIYSFGVMLYEMIVGRTPFVRAPNGTVAEVLVQHATAPVPPMRTFAPDMEIPEHLEYVVMRSLDKNPDARFQTMREILDLLEGLDRALHTGDFTGQGVMNPDTQRFMRGGSMAAPLPVADPEPTTTSAPLPAPPPPQRSKAPMIAALAALVIGIAALAFFLTRPKDTPPDPAPQAATTPAPTTAPPPVTTPPKPAEPVIVTVNFSTSPTGAAIELDGKPLLADGGAPALTPFSTTLPTGANVRVKLSKEGHLDLEEYVTIAGPLNISRKLERLEANTPPTPPPTARTITVAFDSKPRGAKVFKGEEEIGTTPFDWKVPADKLSDTNPTPFTIKLTGYNAYDYPLGGAPTDGDTLSVSADLVKTKGGTKPPKDPKDPRDPKDPKLPELIVNP
jgi:serine/threonine protein kinase